MYRRTMDYSIRMQGLQLSESSKSLLSVFPCVYSCYMPLPCFDSDAMCRPPRKLALHDVLSSRAAAYKLPREGKGYEAGLELITSDRWSRLINSVCLRALHVLNLRPPHSLYLRTSCPRTLSTSRSLATLIIVFQCGI